MKKDTLKKLTISLIGAILLTAVCWFGALYALDHTVSDAMFQRPAASDGDILIIGIDSQSLDELGRYQDWDRGVWAKVLETLNADPEYRPAAIGLDVLFLGETTPEADKNLVEAASLHDNVVIACYADFESGMSVQESEVVWDDFRVIGFEEAFSALRDVTRLGHINAMMDDDGILRNALLHVDLPDGRRVPSFNWQLFELYATQYDVQTIPPPVNSRGFWYVDFTGEPGDYYEELGVSALLSGEIDPDYYAGRVVLVGPYTVGLQDNYPTAIARGQNMYGVEYQANCLEALIRGEFKSHVANSVQAAIVFVLIFVCLFFFRDKKLLLTTVIWAGLTVGWLAASMLLYDVGFLLHPLWVPATVTIVYVASVAVNYARAAMEKRRVTSTFKKYVAPEIVNEILKQGADDLTAVHMCDIAVLFVDIRGFTPLSEMLEPEQVVEVLNRYLTLTSTCIMNNQGTLDKFIGDATMAFWGAPLPQDDYIYKAVKTALDMIDGAKAVGDELMERFGKTVSFGIGVHCGKAVVGNIGAAHRMDYTAIGDTVNTTARLESNAPAGQLYVSRAVADALEGRIQVTSLGSSIKLKGKTEGFEVLRVEGLS